MGRLLLRQDAIDDNFPVKGLVHRTSISDLQHSGALLLVQLPRNTDLPVDDFHFCMFIIAMLTVLAMLTLVSELDFDLLKRPFFVLGIHS